VSSSHASSSSLTGAVEQQGVAPAVGLGTRKQGSSLAGWLLAGSGAAASGWQWRAQLAGGPHGQ